MDNEEPSLIERATRAAARRRSKTEVVKCSQDGCFGDGRYQPPGRGHRSDCEHDAIKWVWEEVHPEAGT